MMVAEKDKDVKMLRCVSGDCIEMIRLPFFLKYSGYCTRHPEKYIKSSVSYGLTSQDCNDKKAEIICEALKRFKGNRKKAANFLSVSERTIYRKIVELGLSVNYKKPKKTWANPFK